MSAKTLAIVGITAVSFMDFRGNLVKRFIKEGFDVHVCLPDCDVPTAVKIGELGARLHHYPADRNGKNLFTDIYTVWVLRTLMLVIQPTHLIAYTIKPVIYSNLALLSVKLRTRSFALITGLGYLFTSKNTKVRLFRFLVTPVYRLGLLRCEKIIFQNNDDRDLFVELGIAKRFNSFTISGSGVDVNHYSPVPLPEHPVFLLIGRLVKDKGVMEYFQAAKKVKQMWPDAQFLMVGFLDSNPTSISQVELDAGLMGASMEFLGRSDDVREAISRCSVYVLPSYREGTPRTVLEAMAMGRAIITTDAPGCKETVQPGSNGLLVEPKSVDSLAQAMGQLMQNPQRIESMGQASRILACEVFCDNLVNNEILRLIHQTNW